MSYILDALKKVEKDRQGETLYSRDDDLPQGKSSSRWWPALALLAVVLNIALAGYIFVGKEPASLGVHAAQPAAPVAPVAAVPVQNPQASRKEEPARQASVSQTPPLRASVPKSRPVVQPLAAEVDIVEHHASQGSPRVVVEPPPARTEQEETIDNLAVDLQVPMLTEKSENFRQSLPDIKVDVHVYSEKPEKRFVLINMAKYHEGETLENGIVVHRITPTGLYLSYHDEHFQIAAQ